MASPGNRISVVPVFFCLLAGISFGLILICYYHTPVDNWEEKSFGDSIPANALLREQQYSSAAAQLSAETGSQQREAFHQTKQASNVHPGKGLRQSLQQNKATQQGSAGSLLNAVTAELDNFKEDDQEDRPDDSVLEHGQDQSPEETERQRLLKKQAAKDELKNIETVKNVMGNAIKQQMESGAGVSENAKQALQSLENYSRERSAVAGSDPEKDNDAVLRKEAVKETAASNAVKEEDSGLKKTLAAHEYVKSLETAKAAAASLQRSETDDQSDQGSNAKTTVSMAGLTQAAAKEKQERQKEKLQALQKELTAAEQSFLYQMSDIMSLSNEKSDNGGQSLQMKFLTEEEANAADAIEWNSKLAYGASEADLVTFLEVQQGMEIDDRAVESAVKIALEGVPLLSIDLVRERAENGLVIVTCANWAYYDFALNWVGHMRKLGVKNFLIGALDHQTSLGLAALGIPGFQMYPGSKGAVSLTTTEFKSELQNIHKLSRQKVALARLFTDFGYDVLLSDVDVVWLRDPVPYFAGYKDANILTASNELSSSLSPRDEGLEEIEAIQKELSMSVLFMRHSKEATRFVKEWDTMLAEGLDRVDQIAFNTLIAKYTTPLRRSIRNDRLATGPQRLVTVGVLPVPLFMNGHTYFVQQLHKEHDGVPISVHVNFNEGGLKGKRHRMREAGLWLDAPAYFDAPNGFVQVRVDKPASPQKDLSDGEMMDFHVDALNQQLKQVRAGIALAVALERTLILPELICYCDRSWLGLERCRAPGADKMALPFVCPLDYVFEPGQFDDGGRQHGPGVGVRDHSFFRHPRLPQKLKESTVMVLPDGADPMRSEPANLALVSQIHIPRNLSEDGLRNALDSQLAVKVLAFYDADASFGGFRDKDWGKSVARRVARLTGTWCCSKIEPAWRGYGMHSALDALTIASKQAL